MELSETTWIEKLKKNAILYAIWISYNSNCILVLVPKKITSNIGKLRVEFKFNGHGDSIRVYYERALYCINLTNQIC